MFVCTAKKGVWNKMSSSKSNSFKNKAEELILDESFIRWVKFGLPEDNRKWENALVQQPDLKNVFAEARLWILEMGFESAVPENSEEIAFYQRLRASIDNTQAINVRRMIPQWLRIAATLTGAIVSLLAAYWALNYYSFKHITTGNGEIVRILLPDSSEVILNANTKVKYERKWNENEPRELWIEGEGFFNIRHINKDQTHIKNSERFIVHTSDLNIQVLGTSFNVNTRRNKTKVVLSAGKIQLSLKDNSKAPIVMVPGDAITYSQQQKAIVKNKSVLNPSVSSAWKEHRLIFVQSNIKEIAEQIEDNLGYTVKINAPSLNNRTISGSVATSNEDVLFKVLADLLNVDIKKDPQNKIILIQEKK
ncbi:Fe2+-dicitrate sensor, membrane component [Solitalea canadensis DSM 3403]|uniref:Fe2+-dicitrate sensor, membrane component n=2 Tax=Solitalea canadensis TaxID=995 RepID=H8KWU9_SOLCM|nr:Fe2+-dicitrate sensor, membrane component [Solitalea canadensis DSM 3403]